MKKIKPNPSRPVRSKASGVRARKKAFKKIKKARPHKKAPKKLKKKHVRVASSRAKVSKEEVDMLLKKGQERGFLTTSEILYSIPNVEHNVFELEKIYDLLKENGVQVREVREFLEVKSKKDKKAKKPILGKIDPIQMYLKEIGKSGFLSAKEEKELAKRIEHGDE